MKENRHGEIIPQYLKRAICLVLQLEIDFVQPVT